MSNTAGQLVRYGNCKASHLGQSTYALITFEPAPVGRVPTKGERWLRGTVVLLSALLASVAGAYLLVPVLPPLSGTWIIFPALIAVMGSIFVFERWIPRVDAPSQRVSAEFAPGRLKLRRKGLNDLFYDALSIGMPTLAGAVGFLAAWGLLRAVRSASPDAWEIVFALVPAGAALIIAAQNPPVARRIRENLSPDLFLLIPQETQMLMDCIDRLEELGIVHARSDEDASSAKTRGAHPAAARILERFSRVGRLEPHERKAALEHVKKKLAYPGMLAASLPFGKTPDFEKDQCDAGSLTFVRKDAATWNRLHVLFVFFARREEADATMLLFEGKALSPSV